MSRYEKERIIGSGTFGSVWLVKSKLTRHSYVLKEISLSSLSDSDLQQALTEVSVLSKCNHRNIVRYKDAVIERDKNVLSIIMEHAGGGDLFTAITEQKGVPFSETRVITWFIQICLALQYLHFQNILHRDLKTKNIFLTCHKVIKVGDFGIARVLKDPEELVQTAIGTPYYLSPEICRRKPYNYKSDIWALGCVLFEMSALEHAFKSTDFMQLVSLILGGKRRDLPRHCSPFVQELVDNLLQINPDDRPSTEEILGHPAMQRYFSDHMFSNRKRDLPVLVSPEERNGRRTSASEIFRALRDNCLKRRASLTGANPKAPKQVARIPAKENVNVVVSNKNTLVGRKSHDRPTGTVSRKGDISQKSHLIPKPKLNGTFKKDMSRLTVSSDTFLIGGRDHVSSKLIKSEDMSFNKHDHFVNSRGSGPSKPKPAKLETGAFAKVSNFLKSGKTSTLPIPMLINEAKVRHRHADIYQGRKSSASKLTKSDDSTLNRVSNCSISAAGYLSKSTQLKDASAIRESTLLSTINRNNLPDLKLGRVKNAVDSATDHGYKSDEANSNSLHISIHKNRFKQVRFPDECFKPTDGAQGGECVLEGAEYISPAKLQRQDIANHRHCQHTQCHRCMLDMLWKNRIRSCVGATSINQNSNLKSQLLLVYRELFDQVYETMMRGWESNGDTISDCTLPSIMDSLSYEQVQSLPLMMQLIQLDIHANSSGNPSIDI